MNQNNYVRQEKRLDDEIKPEKVDNDMSYHATQEEQKKDDNFSFDDEIKINELMQNKGIIRNRRKIEAIINNAKVFMDIQKNYGTFSNYIWSYTNNKVLNGVYQTKNTLSDTISHDLKSKGMSFVGSTIIYAYLQAIGIINDHEESCFKNSK